LRMMGASHELAERNHLYFVFAKHVLPPSLFNFLLSTFLFASLSFFNEFLLFLSDNHSPCTSALGIKCRNSDKSENENFRNPLGNVLLGCLMKRFISFATVLLSCYMPMWLCLSICLVQHIFLEKNYVNNSISGDKPIKRNFSKRIEIYIII
jgi:hypothetical protein